ncbi:MAG: carbamoyltransferase [Candidatus Omnitrophota bacterium]|nr:carbamoyltransferase [Candidatus Omnitrophota bacterium]
MTTRILGISAYYHDAAACLLVDGQIVAAAQEERFTRKKHDERFPSQAIAYCLKAGGIPIETVDLVGFYEKPIVKFERLIETYLGYAPRGVRSFLMAMPVWLGEKLWLSDTIQRELGWTRPVLFGDHHESHAASAFYPSPFEEAAILTMDAVGEWATASYGYGKGSELVLLEEMRFPHSLGLLYSAFTYFCGFKVNSGEYKLMGLAPYGEPRYVDTIRDHLVDIREDGSLWLNLEYFNYCTGLTMTSSAFERLFEGPPRKPEGPITQREMDLARSIQEVTEEVMLRMARQVYRQTQLPYLCLAGGVALNCVGNGRILREGPFKEVWVQPAAGDAGGALGVAMALWHRYLGKPRLSPEREGTWRPATRLEHAPAPVTVGAGGERVEGVTVTSAHEHNGLPAYADRMQGALLGPAFSEEEIGAWLARHGYPAARFEQVALVERVAELLAAGKVIGLFQSRMEFGPRALGARSIIGDARSPAMQSLMNLKIKFRESFRPFAPCVLREHVADWFAFDGESPYMLLVADVAAHRRLPLAPADEARLGLEKLKIPRSEIPAVTHVDHSARIQTVRREHNPLFYDILRAFYERTGCPVIINTSFNVRGEPIVCTPEDAYRCFMRTQIDALVLECFVIEKAEQTPMGEPQEVWQRELAPD